ncbi:MAG: ATP-binding protein [Bacteroidota bacterium]
MQKKYPFKFLDAYTREDADIFFGREEEVNTLYEMVFQTDLLLIYGASGTGKTSLIQCGLASRFQTHDWLALFIRRREDLNESLDRSLLNAGGTIEEHNDDLDWLDDDFSTDANTATNTQLSPIARRLRAIYLRHFKSIYLIFDQFEELYILGNRQEQDRFIETVKEILRVEQPVKIIISIREEYLGYLYEFERKVPELLRKKLRVEPMNLEKVKTVVKKVGVLPQSNVHLAKGEEDQIAAGIFEKIRGKDKTLSIQLPYLQVLLDKLYLQVTGDESRKAEATFSHAALQQIGDIGDVLRNFLDEQVLRIAQQQDQDAKVIWQLLSPFVTLEGTKEPLSEVQLKTRLPDLDDSLIHRTLQAFWKGRILRYNEQEEVYEVMHDSLAGQIHARRTDEEIALLEVQRLVKSQTILNAQAREYFSEKQLDMIAPYREQLILSKEEEQYLRDSRKHVDQEKRKRRNRLRWTVFGVITALVIMAGLTVWALDQQKIANNRSDELEEQKNELNQTLTELKNEQARRAKIEFENLTNRAREILNVDGCPKTIWEQMDSIAGVYPDINAFTDTLNSIEPELLKISDCLPQENQE